MIWISLALAGTPLCDALLVDAPSPARVQAALQGGEDPNLSCPVAKTGRSLRFSKDEVFVSIVFPPYFVGKLLFGGTTYQYTEQVPPLVLAAMRRNPEVIRLLLASGADPNTRGALALALTDAPEWGSLGVVQALVSGGVKLDPQNDIHPAMILRFAKGSPELWAEFLALGVGVDVSSGATALVLAVSEGHKVAMERLLIAGADPSGRNGRAPLLEAVKTGNVEMAGRLVAAGASVQPGMLYEAARTGKIEIVRWALEAGLFVDEPGPFEETALCVAAGRGDLGMMELLLSKGANPNSDGFFHRTPLKSAVEGGHIEAVALLLGSGASAKIEESSLLDYALRSNKEPLARYLLANGSTLGVSEAHPTTVLHGHASIDTIQLAIKLGLSPDVLDRYGRTPLMVAAESCDESRMKALVGVGADPKLKGSKGNTLAHYVARCSLPVLELVKLWGVDVRAVNEDGWTPLHRAAALGRDGLKMLVEAGVPIDARDNQGRTALLIAAAGRSYDALPAVSLLISLGASVAVQDHQGYTALDWAVENNNYDMVGYLIGKGAPPGRVYELTQTFETLRTAQQLSKAGVPFVVAGGIVAGLERGDGELVSLALVAGCPVGVEDFFGVLLQGRWDLAEKILPRLELGEEELKGLQKRLRQADAPRYAQKWLREQVRLAKNSSPAPGEQSEK